MPFLRYRVAAPDWRTWKKLAGMVNELEFLEDEVRGRICEELRFGLVAMWCDPLERLGVVAKERRGLTAKHEGRKIAARDGLKIAGAAGVGPRRPANIV